MAETNIAEKAVVLTGVVNVAFDNEQRLVKNYFARADSKVTHDIFTKIWAMKLDQPVEVNKRCDFKTCNWRLPKEQEVLPQLT